MGNDLALKLSPHRGIAQRSGEKRLDMCQAPDIASHNRIFRLCSRASGAYGKPRAVEIACTPSALPPPWSSKTLEDVLKASKIGCYCSSITGKVSFPLLPAAQRSSAVMP
jgi:hypothetical protein